MIPAVPKVHEAVARSLAENGVNTMFGLMGDANIFMVTSFVRDCAGRFIAAAHEAGAATMALGYAQVSNTIGVCSVTHGPAMVNTATALAHGVKASVPMVLLCGDTHIEHRSHSQNIAQREFVIAAGAGFEQLRSPRTVAEDVATVLRRAVAERRPIALNLPRELDWSDAENYRPIRNRIPESRAVVTGGDDLDTAIGIIAASKRPLVLAGRGARSPETKRAIAKLAARIEAPLMTTLKAKDLFRGEDFNLGICGTVSSPIAVETIIESDCIISFGASLNDKTLSAGTFRNGKKIIQVNLEPAEIGKHFVPDAGMVGDPAGVAELLIHWLDEAEIPPSGFRTEELRQRIAAEQPELGAHVDHGDGTVDYMHALAYLERMLPKDRVLVTDGGRFMLNAWTMLSVREPHHFVSTVDFGSIGLGMPHAIGACFGAPGHPVVLITGDGGFMHGGLVEFNTAVRHGADLIVVVCNDRAYGAEYVTYQKRQMTPELSLFDWPDFAPLAIGLGGEGVTVKSAEDWPLVEQAIKNRTKPLLIDINLDPARLPLY